MDLYIDKIYVRIDTFIFHTFVPELYTSIYTRMLFPLNFLIQIDRILPNFIYAFIMTRSSNGLLPVIFRKFVSDFVALDLR